MMFSLLGVNDCLASHGQVTFSVREQCHIVVSESWYSTALMLQIPVELLQSTFERCCNMSWDNIETDTYQTVDIFLLPPGEDQV